MKSETKQGNFDVDINYAYRSQHLLRLAFYALTSYNIMMFMLTSIGLCITFCVFPRQVNSNNYHSYSE